MSLGSTEIPELYIPPGMENKHRFNPEGAMRMTNLEMGAFGGGTVALLLQLYNPAVAHILSGTGELGKNPMKRLRGNAVAGINMIFGTWKENQKIAHEINTAHAKFPAAMKQEHLGWVGATLIYGSILGYETFVGKLPDHVKDEYMREGAKPLFEQLHLDLSTLPGTYRELEEYISARVRSGRYHVTDEARNLAPHVLLSQTLLPDIRVSLTQGRLKGLSLRVRRPKIEFGGPGEIAMSPAKLITLGLMQENDALDQVKREFGFQDLSPLQARTFDAFAAGIRKVVPHLPGRIRYNKRALAAQRRDLPAKQAA